MYGIKYISAIEAAERWHLSRRRVVALCGDGRITGAQKAGAYWIIPENAKKPSDARVKTGGKGIKLRQKSFYTKTRRQRSSDKAHEPKKENEASALHGRVGALRHFTGGATNEKAYHNRTRVWERRS